MTKRKKPEPVKKQASPAPAPEVVPVPIPAPLSSEVAPATEVKHVSLALVGETLLEAPVYEPHVRGKNWLAVIDVDGTMPSGLSRRWMPRGRGESKYLVSEIVLFDPIEFGADYTTARGDKQRTRWYGVVVGKTPTHLVVEQTKTGARAVLRAKLARGDLDSLVKSLEYEKQSLLSRVFVINEEIEGLRKEAKEMGAAVVSAPVMVSGVSCDDASPKKACVLPWPIRMKSSSRSGLALCRDLRLPGTQSRL